MKTNIKELLGSKAFWAYILSLANGLVLAITMTGSFLLFVAMGAASSFYLLISIFLALILALLAIPLLFYTKICALLQLVLLVWFIPIGLLLGGALLSYFQNGDIFHLHFLITLSIFIGYTCQIVVNTFILFDRKAGWGTLDNSLPRVFRNFLALLPFALVIIFAQDLILDFFI